MRIALHVQSGPAAGRRIVLRSGQTARFGKTDWSDYAFVDDLKMADVHFAIHCDTRGCTLRSLADGFPTLLNAKAVTEAVLANGDVILAGQSQLQVMLDGVPGDILPTEAAVPVAVPVVVEDVVALATTYGLSAEGIKLAERCSSGAAFTDLLLKQNLVMDAMRWQSHRLPKQSAVLWACSCVHDAPGAAQLPAVQQQAIQAAETWAREPTEAHRRQAVEFIEQTKVEGIGGALAVAAGWSGGSLTAEDQEVVPPDEMLTGRAVFTALLLTGYMAGPAHTAKDRFRSYIQRSAGENALPKRGG